jgi:hypothetical protein
MSVRAFFSSPRRRRRTIRLAILLVAALGVAYLIAFDRNTARSDESADQMSTEPAAVYKDVPQARLPRTDYTKARDVAFAFIRTAVERRHLKESCALVTRQMKQGMTCEQWQHDDIPVVPYDPDESRSKYAFEYSYRNSIGIKFALYPKPGSRLPPSAFRIEVDRVGSHGRWLVNDWQPAGSESSTTGGNNFAQAGSEPRLGARWLLVPVGIFATLLVLLLGVATREWRRRRRADRAYPPSPLPPLRS